MSGVVERADADGEAVPLSRICSVDASLAGSVSGSIRYKPQREMRNQGRDASLPLHMPFIVRNVPSVRSQMRKAAAKYREGRRVLLQGQKRRVNQNAMMAGVV